ncbi:MAG: tetratricopeptide repeat protein [Deltaproteobacteria bacterium]|nr:tetratricopeptide repeat protein [Deltaproteobacteria bacterium]MBW2419524.1 tetratricopeptide repeat protein [Deltaproteobacteria bacterium]
MKAKPVPAAAHEELRRQPSAEKRGRSWLVPALALLAAVACGERADDAGSAPLSGTSGENEASKPTLAREAFEYWAPLVTTGRFEEARVLCTPWLEKQEPSYRTEAHKCLANVAIADDSLPVPAPDPRGGRPQGPRVGAEGVDLALHHYDQAILLTPSDRDAHIGRADVLILGGRYDAAIESVEQSLERFTTRADLDAFLLLTARFRMMNRNEEAFEFLRVLETVHPLDHRIVANLGAFHSILGRNDEALEYAQRAVALAPDDPLNRWNLAQLYDRRSEFELADKSFRQALDLLQDTDPEALCRYADFIADRLDDPNRACDYALLECPRYFDEHCEGGVSRAAAERPRSS